MTKKTQAEVVTTKSNLPVETGAAWGAAENLDANDLLVPKIFHQQALSKFVSNGDAKAGDFCDSLTGEVLAGKDSKLEVIVFGLFKTMIVSKQDTSGKFKLDQIVAITPENVAEWANKAFTEEVHGQLVKNSLQYNFYCMVPSKLGELPYILSLGGAKTKTARKLNTMLTKLSLLKRPSAAVVFELKSVAEKNDQGSWWGIDITQGRDATPDELEVAHLWYVKSKSQKIAAAEDDSDHEPASGIKYSGKEGSAEEVDDNDIGM